MVHRPKVTAAIEYGNAASFWVEYPSGLVDLTRTTHLPKANLQNGSVVHEEPAQDAPVPPLREETQLEIPVDGGRVLRFSKKNTAIVVVDMQK